MKIFAETDRLFVRDWKESDIPAYVSMNADEKVMEFFLKKLTTEESLQMLEIIRTEIATSGFGFFAIERKEDNCFIGFVGLHAITFDVDFAPAIEVGWRLLPSYWGKGYAVEAAKACFALAKDKLGLDEIVAFTSLPNINSQRVMQKLGMQFVKEFEHPQVPINHSLQKHLLYKKSLIG